MKMIDDHQTKENYSGMFYYPLDSHGLLAPAIVFANGTPGGTATLAGGIQAMSMYKYIVVQTARPAGLAKTPKDRGATYFAELLILIKGNTGWQCDKTSELSIRRLLLQLIFCT